jgi:hypothetical protein
MLGFRGGIGAEAVDDGAERAGGGDAADSAGAGGAAGAVAVAVAVAVAEGHASTAVDGAGEGFAGSVAGGSAMEGSAMEDAATLGVGSGATPLRSRSPSGEGSSERLAAAIVGAWTARDTLGVGSRSSNLDVPTAGAAGLSLVAR